MPELDVSDVDSFTGGRLSEDDDEVARMLAAALRTARRYCGWSVTPIVTDFAVTLDGPCSKILTLPTRRLVELTSITEDGTVIDLSTIRWSAGGPPGILERPVSVRKKSGGWWKSYYSCIDVVMTHGYDDDEAADWRYAVLSMVDQMGQALVSGRGELDMVSKKVDDVTYRWTDPYATAADAALYSVNSIFEAYCLPKVEFI